MPSSPLPPLLPAPHARPARGLAGIVAGNALTLAVALWQQWTAADLLWPFWLQSLVIGWYARRRLLLAPRLTVHAIRINGRRVTDPDAVRRFFRWFFVVHYGGFHAVYAIFLLLGTRGTSMSGDWWLYALLGLSFWFAHRASHRAHLEADTAGPRSAGLLMAMPYLRIVPMHVAIIAMARLDAGDHAPGFVAMFIALKTVADVGSHLLEHRLLARAR